MKYTVIVLFMCSVSFTRSDPDRRTTSKRIHKVHIDPPNVEALSPKGLRVSLRHIDGMQLFAFHAKINSAIRRTESGSIARDITHPVNGYWTFEDCDIELRIGDVINYWIFVEVNGMGYRLDNLSEIIKERVSPDRDQFHFSSSDSFISSSSSEKRRTSTINAQRPVGCNCDLSELKTITTQLNVTLMQVNNLNNKLIPMQLQIESLTELLTELFKDQNIGTQLLLVGEKPPGTNAVEAIRQLITEKLELVDLENKIQQAYSTENGIYFEMSSPVDKKRILFRAGQRLEDSSYQIVDPTVNRQSQPYITAAMVRMGGGDYAPASNRNREGYRPTSTSENAYLDPNWSTSTVRPSPTSTRRPTPQSSSSRERENLISLNSSKSRETQYVAEEEDDEDRSTFSGKRYGQDSRTTTDRPRPYNSNSRHRQQSSYQLESLQTSNERYIG